MYDTTYTTSASTPHLRVFGELGLYTAAGQRIGEPRRKPLALLALLVSAGADGMDRAALAKMLWPELDDVHARRTLAQTVYALRRELGSDDAIVGTHRLTCSNERLTSDIGLATHALARGDGDAARAVYGGPFLDGTYFRGCQDFDAWVEHERGRWEAVMNALPHAGQPMASDSLGASTERVDRAASHVTSLIGATHIPAPARRSARVAAIVLVAAAIVLVAGLAVLPGNRTAIAAAQAPVTAWQELAQQQKQTSDAYLASIDSSRLGRVLFLTPTNVARSPRLDSLIPVLEWILYATHEQAFTHAVEKATALRLQETARQNRLPTSSELDIANMMRMSGAGIAIRSNLHVRGDTFWVALTAYRDLSKTSLAEPGWANLESDNFGGWTTRDMSARGAIGKAARLVFDYVHSLESCDADKHRWYRTAPWCWQNRQSLQLVAGTAQDRLSDWSREMFRLRGE